MSSRPLRVENQFLSGEPAHALHETALDLADIDRRIEGASDIVQDVHAPQPVLARQRVDDDFRARGSVGEIEERPARCALARSQVMLRRLVVARLGELHARQNAFLRQFGEGEAFVADEDAVVAKCDLVLRQRRRPRPHGRSCGALMAPAAMRAAMPLRSEPEDAAVGEVLGTFAVVVAVMRTRSIPMPNSSATTCATLM